MTVLWMTGLSGAGKTTLAKVLSQRLHRSIVIDGDIMRAGLCSDLGYDLDSRKENMRRLAYVSKFLDDNGFSPIVPVICPTNKMRNLVAKIIGSSFRLVHVKCSLDVCMKRDVKGLYAKVKRGKIKDFTGIDSTFEEPIKADIIVETSNSSVEDCVEKILRFSW